MDPSTHKALKEKADELGESLNSLCLKRLVGTPLHVSSVPVQKLISEFKPIGVALFGSAARDESRDSSDIDLLIVLDRHQTISRQLYSQWDQVFPTEKKLSPQFVQWPELEAAVGSLWLEVALDGEILYDPTQQLKKSLRRIRKMIAEGRYQRKSSHGHSYWVSQEP